MGKIAQNKGPALERVFEDKVVAILRQMGFYVTPKINTLHRGLPDRFVCAGGRFIGVEFKRTASEARRKTGRIVLQHYVLDNILHAGGWAYTVHPDNLDEFMEDLKELMHD